MVFQLPWGEPHPQDRDRELGREREVSRKSRGEQREAGWGAVPHPAQVGGAWGWCEGKRMILVWGEATF